ncbi:MAG: hypothetical protein RSA09_03245 [Acinetobacter sp.]
MINQIELLEKLGIAAFGNAWKASLADTLKIARPTITDWTTGKKPIPVGVWVDIQKIIESRLMGLQGALLEIKEQRHLIIVQEMERKGKVFLKGVLPDYLFSMSDDEITGLLAAYKEEYLKCSTEYPNDFFADLATIKDAIDFNICIRDIGGNLDLSLAEQCAISYEKNLKLAQSFDLDQMFLIERVKELFSNY